MTHVKICCIRSLGEVNLAIRYGAYALGFVSRMPTGPGWIPDDRIRELAGAVPAGVRRFLLTCKREPSQIIQQVRDAGTDTLQLVDRMETADLVTLRGALPDVSLVQVVHVNGESAISEAECFAPHVDIILLDSGTPDTSELGGTGRTHDWEVSAEIVRRVPVPVFLAGGLRPDNVAEAIRQVRPYGVDVCSRLRPHGHLDESLLAGFFEAVNGAALS